MFVVQHRKARAHEVDTPQSWHRAMEVLPGPCLYWQMLCLVMHSGSESVRVQICTLTRRVLVCDVDLTVLVFVGVCSTVFFLALVEFIWTQDSEVLQSVKVKKKG